MKTSYDMNAGTNSNPLSLEYVGDMRVCLIRYALASVNCKCNLKAFKISLFVIFRAELYKLVYIRSSDRTQ